LLTIYSKPKWIGRQHLDIYIEEVNIGIEYMGSQHYESIDFFGGEESLKKTIERDRVKKEKCLQNNCILIVVKEDYILSELIDFIKNSSSSSSRNLDSLYVEFP
jgi:hypothetical protein